MRTDRADTAKLEGQVPEYESGCTYGYACARSVDEQQLRPPLEHNNHSYKERSQSGQN